jgi:hypothetical protein
MLLIYFCVASEIECHLIQGKNWVDAKSLLSNCIVSLIILTSITPLGDDEGATYF